MANLLHHRPISVTCAQSTLWFPSDSVAYETTLCIQANAAGLSKDLGISSRQYSIVLTIFYVPYILAEYPAALLMKRLGPHIMLPALTLSFGLVTALQGLVTSYGGLIACRIVLAITEGKPK